jgi:hypothetical protein
LERVLPDPPARVAPESLKELLNYFLRNPDAADTLEGIVRWRLIEERVRRGVEEVDQVLAWLVETGCVLRELRGRDVIFRFNKSRSAEAARLMKGSREN